MKRITSILLIVILFVGFTSNEVVAFNLDTISNINIQGEAAVLIEKETGEILYEKNMEQKMYPASTTKIMTAIIALEYGDLEEMVTVGKEIEEIPWYSNTANLIPGEKITLHQLLYGLLLPSGNDAANTIAVHISKKITNNPDLSQEEAYDEFAKLMNHKSKELGAKNTNFKNPHGFHHVEQFTTPLDMAIIGKAAMENHIFREIVGTQEVIYSGDGLYPGSNQNEKKWENTNYLIQQNNKNFYPYTTGIKTGNTAAAGKCLVSSATKDNLDLISVVLKSTNEDVWEDSISLLSYGFENYEKYTLTKEGQKFITVGLANAKSNNLNKVDIITESTVEELVNKNDIVKIKEEIFWKSNALHKSSNDKVLNVSSSIQKGEILGDVIYSLDGEIIGESRLIASQDIKKDSFILRWIIYSIIIIMPISLMRIFRKSKSK